MPLASVWSEHLSSPEYLHVLLNPLPVYGLAMGLIGLIVAFFLKSRPAQIVALTTGQKIPKNVGDDQKRRSSEAASILGKLGGSKGGKERARRLSAKRRKEIAEAAAAVRWSKNLPE